MGCPNGFKGRDPIFSDFVFKQPFNKFEKLSGVPSGDDVMIFPFIDCNGTHRNSAGETLEISNLKIKSRSTCFEAFHRYSEQPYSLWYSEAYEQEEE